MNVKAKNGLLVLFFMFLIQYAAGQDFTLAGFATLGNGTSGGKGGEEVWVSTGTELQNAINAQKKKSTPLIIWVEGTITPENSAGLDKIEVKEVRNISILGSVKGADFNGIGIKIRRVSNVIIRNVSVHHVLIGEKDCIGVEGPADHVWIDHCELYNEYGDVDGDGDEDDNDKYYYDGLLDTKKDALYITYSWNYLHDSWKTSLVGSSESDTTNRMITLHHNYYENCYSRLPLFRGGTGHIFNCWYHNIVSTAINTRLNACIKVENNHFEQAKNPWVSAFSDILGGLELVNNLRENSPSDFTLPDTHEPLNCSLDIPYEYKHVLTSVDSVKLLVSQYAGTGKLADPSVFETLATGLSDDNIFLNKTNKLVAYVNPATGKLRVLLPCESGQNIRFGLYSINGCCFYSDNQLVLTQEITLSFPLDNIASGMYLLKAENAQNSWSTLWVKY